MNSVREMTGGPGRGLPALAPWVLLLGLLSSLPGYGQQPSKPANWEAWGFLLGEWVGEGSGQPGRGSGGFSFYLDLQERVLVRRNYARYPATEKKPASSHDDIMVIHQEEGVTKAEYFDNEGHVIHYRVSFPKDSSSVMFLSDIRKSAPRYRLTYRKAGEGTVTIAFEIAPPGKPDVFSRYVEASAKKKGM